MSIAEAFQNRRNFSRFSLLVLLYNIPVILWGAYVRVSFSGDGCGADWPFCAGHVIPQKMARPMIIEFTHRMMTSLDLFLMAALVFWAFRIFTRGHAVRRYAIWSAIFLFIEALLGAGLVLFRMVAHDQSAGRAIYLSAHLTNTLLLLGALTITTWLAGSNRDHVDWHRISRPLAAALAVTVLISITGALAALGDTLFPASSVAAGFQQDFSNQSAALLRLRLFHPAIALCGATYLLWSAVKIARRSLENSPARTAAVRVAILVLLQVTIGATNIVLLAPVWMQLFHLLMADLLWLAVIIMVMEAASASLRTHDMVIERTPTLSPTA